MTDCLLVGGGIIGLSLAYELSRRGVTVTIVEQGEWGGQASSAAAGMLAPLKEFRSPGPLLDFGMESLRLYPEWVQDLQAVTRGDVQLSLDGLLTVALTDGEADELHAKYRWQKEAGYDVRWLTGREVQEVEPLVTPQAVAAVYSAKEGHINNRMLLHALVSACRTQGVTLMSGCVVTALKQQAGRIIGIDTTAGPVFADQTIITAGAWAGILLKWLGLSVSVHPVRGQIAAVGAAGIPLRTIVFGTTGYITPKRDGRIVIGATEDAAGFQQDVTLGGLAAVCSGVLPYVPVLQHAPFLEAWAGLRPATGDGKPILGPIAGWGGLSIAGGHFRNGILLAPVTAGRMADWILHGRIEPLLPFLPERFSALPAT